MKLALYYQKEGREERDAITVGITVFAVVIVVSIVWFKAIASSGQCLLIALNSIYSCQD